MRAMTERARLLRASSTLSERILWEALRGRRLAGTKWRRQQKLGRFVVDFFCADAALAVEIDGRVHQGRQDLDAARQSALERSGVRVVRFTASEVEADLPGVLARLSSLVTAPSPLAGPRGRGGACASCAIAWGVRDAAAKATIGCPHLRRRAGIPRPPHGPHRLIAARAGRP